MTDSDQEEVESKSFDSIEDVLRAFGTGEIVVVVDDEDAASGGDLMMAAQFATEEALAFLIRNSSGVVCAAVSEDRADELDLRLMVKEDPDAVRAAFTVTVSAAKGVTTGISASDRSRTLRCLADRQTSPEDLQRPGHVFPLRARDGGVLKRAGRAEAAVDLALLAKTNSVGVLCEVVNPDGSLAGLEQLVAFAKANDLRVVTIADLIRYRRKSEKLVTRCAEATVPTKHGDFNAVVYESVLDAEQHVAFVYGEPESQKNVLVRVHSECLTGDIFGSLRCDCGPQLDAAMAKIVAEGHGVLVYLRGHEGRGIGLAHKIRAYSLQDQGLDTVDANLSQGLPADSREYGIGAQILVDLGITTMRLMTNNPKKYHGIQGYGLELVGRVEHETVPTEQNIEYLRTKRERMGHLLEFDDVGGDDVG